MGATEFGKENGFLIKEKVRFSQKEQDFRLIKVRLPIGSFFIECFYFMVFKL